jgi:formylglycine-generating enzyme required for sulfatase activity
VVARGRPSNGQEATICRAFDDVLPPGLVAGGSERDVTELGIRNLAGNVGEWSADGFAAYDDPCWGPTCGFSVDPRCVPATPDSDRAVRGSSWYLAPMFARSDVRRYNRPNLPLSSIGFRCAR